MTTPSINDQITNEINSLQSRLSWLQDGVRLKSTLDSVEDLQTHVNGLRLRIANLRSKGYIFEKGLEAQAIDFSRQWSLLQPSINNQVNAQTTLLQGSIRSIEQRMTQINGLRSSSGAVQPLITAATSEIQILEDKVRSAESTISGMFNSFKNEVDHIENHLIEVEYMLSQLAEARFQLLAGEAGILAVKAVWCKDVKEQPNDPDGVFYLTDQRVIFEQKEEIATKKILFITTEKQKVQEVKWEIPVSLISEIKPSKQGLLKNEDHLDIRFSAGAQLESVHIHIWQEANTWLQLLNKAKNREFDADRVVAIDQAAVNKIKAAPTQCPSCGANLNQAIMRGQDSIKCDYCGFVIRL